MRNGIQLTQHIVAAITRVKEYIDEHPLDIKTTTELAEYAGIGRNLLQKAFRKLNGDGIKNYYTAQKMEAAKRMLADGMPVKLIARLCRYRSHSSFTTAFKNKFGIAPVIWQNE